MHRRHNVNISLPAFRDKRRVVKRKNFLKDVLPAVHAGVLSKTRHKDGEVMTINENLRDISGFTAEDAPT